MFKYRSQFYESDEIKSIRNDLYRENGFHVVKEFADKQDVYALRKRWFSGDYNYYFSDYIKNQDIRFGSPDYMAKRPNEHDWSFCCHLWNQPIDEMTHDIILEANRFRNLVEGRPLSFGTRFFDPLLIQYRVCRTLSDGQAVYPHADMMEEYRPDPMGDHTFDPRRCQLTLILSDYGKDYNDGGFKLTTNKDKEILFGRDVEVGAGDLIIWRYANKHEVLNVKAQNKDIGFARIICPPFTRSYLEREAPDAAA